MKEKKVGTRCCLDPLYSLGSKFNLTFMKVATFSLGLGLSPNLKPNVVTAIFFSSFSMLFFKIIIIIIITFYIFFSQFTYLLIGLVFYFYYLLNTYRLYYLLLLLTIFYPENWTLPKCENRSGYQVLQLMRIFEVLTGRFSSPVRTSGQVLTGSSHRWLSPTVLTDYRTENRHWFSAPG